MIRSAEEIYMKCLEKYPYTESTTRYLYFFGGRGLSKFGHLNFDLCSCVPLYKEIEVAWRK
jgi:hypothetical protein